MKLVVVGSTGRTGTHVVSQALVCGHQVTALCRSPEPPGTWPEAGPSQLRVVTGIDVLDHDALSEPVAGTDAIISTLGIGTSRAPTQVYSTGTANMLHAMQLNGVKRIAVVSATPVGPRVDQPLLERLIAIPVLEHFFGATYDDMRRMEDTLRHSDVDWVSLRPPRLIDRKAEGTYRIEGDHPLPKARSITCADLATALLDALNRPELHRRAATVAN